MNTRIPPISRYRPAIERLPESPDLGVERLMASYMNRDLDEDQICAAVIDDMRVLLQHYTQLGVIEDVEWDITATYENDQLEVVYDPVALDHAELEFAELELGIIVTNTITGATFTASTHVEAKARAAALSLYHPEWLPPE